MKVESDIYNPKRTTEEFISDIAEEFTERVPYIGSVKFFRHIIVGTILLLIIALAIATIISAVKINDQTDQIDSVTQELLSAYSTINITNDELNLAVATIDEYTAFAAGNPEYSSLYPDLYSTSEYIPNVNEKTVYLTFDDGPCGYTEELLDILAENGVKATFFLVGNEIDESNEDLLVRMVEEGHTVAVHTTTHVYNDIYDSVEAFLDDFAETYYKIYEITGVAPEIFRFPGGSINSYNLDIYEDIIAEMLRRGFIYYDWNVSAGDASSSATTDSIYYNSTLGLQYSGNVIILMHETSAKTISQVENIINTYKENDYTFDILTKEVQSISFAYTY